MTYTGTNVLIKRFANLPIFQQAHFLCGFLDGEGSFTVSFRKSSSKSPQGYLYHVYVGISLYQKNLNSNVEFLHYINDEFFNKIGRVRPEGAVYRLDMNGRVNMSETVLPFLTKYNQIFISKHSDFEAFKKVVKIMEKHGRSLTRTAYLEIVELAYSMNQDGKQRKISKEEMIRQIHLQYDYLESRK